MEMTTHTNGQSNGSIKKLTLKELQTHIISVIVGAVTSGIVIVVFFYFNTNYTLANHTERLDTVEKRLTNVESNIGDMKIDMTTVKNDVGYLKKDVSEIKDSQKQMQEDIKDIYKIVLTLKNK